MSDNSDFNFHKDQITEHVESIFFQRNLLIIKEFTYH